MPSRQKLYIHSLCGECLWKFCNIKYVQLVLSFKNVKAQQPRLQNSCLQLEGRPWKTVRRVLELCHFFKENKIGYFLSVVSDVVN